MCNCLGKNSWKALALRASNFKISTAQERRFSLKEAFDAKMWYYLKSRGCLTY